MDKYNKSYTFNNKWIGYILFMLILQFAFLFYCPLLFQGKEAIKWNLWNYLPIINSLIAIFLIQALVERTDYIGRYITISKLLCWLGFIFALYALLQFCGIDQIFSSNLRWVDNANPHELGKRFATYRMITFFGNKMQTATFLAIISPLCLMFKTLKYKLMYTVIAITILLTQSLIGIAGLIAGLLTYIFLTKKLKVFIISTTTVIVLSTILYLFRSDLFADYGKLSLYKQVFIKSLDTIFTGTGLGSFPMLKYHIGNYNVDNLGFEPLQLLQEGGIFLLGLIVIYIIDLFRRIILSKETILSICTISAFISFLICSCGGYTLHIPTFALIGLLLIASLETQTLWKGEL